ncbi:unnamed protein product [Rhodiola kirilowii]
MPSYVVCLVRIRNIYKALAPSLFFLNHHRTAMSSATYVASRARDATFEKFMDGYKNLVKVVSIQDLILASPKKSQSVSIEFLNRLSQKFHLNRGAASFLRKYPHIFHIFYDISKSQPYCGLTDAALRITCDEAVAINATLPDVTDRLVRVLSMSTSRSVPLRAVFKVWRELGLPDDFEDSVISRNPQLFELIDAQEPNTHTLRLVQGAVCHKNFSAAADNWRVIECCNVDSKFDHTGNQYGLKHTFPPGMRLSKDYKTKVREWQKLPYLGPYSEIGVKKKSKTAIKELEKRAVGIMHEFLSLTVEKMVEVEKVSHFRNCFGIELNMRDLFLDHPGIFYLSTKGKRHTVFLREAYERGHLIHSNPVYEVRRKLLDLVLLGRRGLLSKKLKSNDNIEDGKAKLQDDVSD